MSGKTQVVRILLVEDYPADMVLLREILNEIFVQFNRPDDSEVHACSTWKDAMDHLHQITELQVAIIDRVIPEYTVTGKPKAECGTRLLRYISQSVRPRPVILEVTAYGEPNLDTQRLRALGIDAILPKHLSRDDLAAQIRKVIQEHGLA